MQVIEKPLIISVRIVTRVHSSQAQLLHISYCKRHEKPLTGRIMFPTTFLNQQVAIWRWSFWILTSAVYR